MPIQDSQNTIAFRFNRRRLITPTAIPTTTGLQAALSPVQSIALAVVCTYLFFVTSRIFDLVLSGLRVPMVFFVLSIIAALVSGTLLQVFQRRMVRVMLLICGWMSITTVFSVYRSSSLEVFQATLIACVFAIALMCVAVSSQSALRGIRTLTYSIFAAAILSFIFGVRTQDRLSLYNGTYGDPNQYAMALLIGLPLILFLARARGLVGKLFSYASAVVIFIAFARAGSRGGAIALFVMLVIWFFHLKFGQKVVMAGAVIAVVFSALALLPDYLRVRYTTLFSAQESEAAAQLTANQLDQLGGDIGSSESRLELLKDGIELTARHPLFGVGPGQFGMERWDLKMKQTGKNVGNFQTHNSYLQMSSENGVIGMILLIALIVLSFKEVAAVLRLRRSTEYKIPDYIFDAAIGLRLALTTLAVCAMFLSVAYSQLFFIAGALACAFRAGVEYDLPKWRIPASAVKETAPAGGLATNSKPIPALTVLPVKPAHQL
jgi:O-antigen ligase